MFAKSSTEKRLDNHGSDINRNEREIRELKRNVEVLDASLRDKRQALRALCEYLNVDIKYVTSQMKVIPKQEDADNE